MLNYNCDAVPWDQVHFNKLSSGRGLFFSSRIPNKTVAAINIVNHFSRNPKCAVEESFEFPNVSNGHKLCTFSFFLFPFPQQYDAVMATAFYVPRVRAHVPTAVRTTYVIRAVSFYSHPSSRSAERPHYKLRAAGS